MKKGVHILENLRLILKGLKKVLLAHKRESAIISGLFVMVVAIGITCAFNVTKDVEVIIDENSAQSSTRTEVITAQLQTPIEEALQKEGYINDDSYSVVNVEDNKKVKDVDSVVVKRNAEGTINVDGQQISYKSDAETVGDLLNEMGVALDDDDFATPDISTKLTTDVQQVDVVRVEVKEETYDQPVAYPTEERENPEYNEGTRTVSTAGVNGNDSVVDQVTYHNGVEVARTNISRTRTLEPVTEVVEVGTKLAVSDSANEAVSGGSATSGNATQATGDNFDMICAIVASECNSSYEGALAVISCVMNRVDSGGWGGSDALSVLTASGQFSGYLDGYYTSYLGGNYPDYVAQAVRDCMEGGIRNHSYESFRAASTGVSGVNIGGNVYF